MVLRQYVSFSLLLIVSCLLSLAVRAQNEYNEKQLEVALRTIGHRLLQKSGDSLSRVLPITKENNRYKIEFESELDFMPDNLFETVGEVVKEIKIRKPFIVEAKDCNTKKVVHSFEIDSLKQLDVLPCHGRKYPKACYQFFFTIKETGTTYSISPSGPESIVKSDNSKSIYYTLGILSLLGIGIFLFTKNRRKDQPIDPNVIRIGQYLFDKRGATLTINDTSAVLSGKEADLLLLLHENLNETVERDKILNNVWGDEGDYIGRTLDVFVSKLRKKLEYDADVKIVNIRGVGYKMIVS